jgi:alpha-amylase
MKYCPSAIGKMNMLGYGVYDLFDLGEFDQKGSIRTKYGTKDEYVAAVAACRAVGIAVYGDAVFNHKMGADAIEEVEATPLDPNLHDRQIGEDRKIQAWTHFTFPGRQGKYSTMEWHWWHFDAVDYNADSTKTKAVYLLKDKQFDRHVDREKNNFDYLMGADLDMDCPEVIDELNKWGEWYVNTTGVDGFRFDAVKHIESNFFVDWIEHVSARTNKSLFAVGEYWSDNIEALKYFIDTTQGKITLFDEHPGGMAVLISNAGEGQKWMEVGQPHTTYIDLTENIPDSIVTNSDGWAEFRCCGGSVSVWIPQ